MEVPKTFEGQWGQNYFHSNTNILSFHFPFLDCFFFFFPIRIGRDPWEVMTSSPRGFWNVGPVYFVSHCSSVLATFLFETGCMHGPFRGMLRTSQMCTFSLSGSLFSVVFTATPHPPAGMRQGDAALPSFPWYSRTDDSASLHSLWPLWSLCPWRKGGAVAFFLLLS